MPKKSSTSKQTSLFDIRLKNHDHDVLVLKGSPGDAASALLSGKIALSVNEPLPIKKLSLRLYSMLHLNWTESLTAAKSGHPKAIRHERKIYEYNWDNNEINKYLNNMYENNLGSGSIAGGVLRKNGSSSSLKSMGGHLRSKSSTSLSNLRHSPTGSFTNLTMLSGASTPGGTKNNHVLVKGNYEIPFSAILPGDIPETVEGLPGASVIYRLEASIDRGKFHNPMIAKKRLRVVRTLTTDAVELSETVAVDNTWPKKVEYSLNVPCKAIAIGSGSPITLMLVPLLKGLRLGEIKISLVEYYSFMGYVPPVNNSEREVVLKTIAAPTDDDPNYQMDKWEVNTFLKVPPSLSKCTQDCDILTNIKVRHKIKFAIGLVNPDGHVSELRASLPVMLFISPFVTVTASVEGESAVNEEYLFTADRSSTTSLTNLAYASGVNSADGALRSNSSSYTSFSGLIAPPLYEQHIYDRLWSDVSPMDSPLNSGAATPREVSTPGVQEHFSMLPVDSVQLNENLRLLSLQRQAQESGASTPDFLTPALPTPSERATFSLEGEPDYFSQRRPNLSNLGSAANLGLLSPGPMSPVHLSRTQSESVLSPQALSQVPSYNQAMKSPEADDIPQSPAYEPPLPGSRVNLEEINKNYELHSRPKTPLSRTSLSSSPASSRNVSMTNLSALSSSVPKVATKLSSSGDSSSEISPSQSSVSVAKLSSIAADRSNSVKPPLRSSSSLSLHNMHFLNKKKDKK